MKKEVKVEVKEEMDGDYGPVLYVFINGVRQHRFVAQRNDKSYNEDLVQVLKATIAQLHFDNEILAVEVRELYDLRSNIRKVLSSVGVR